MNYAEAKIAGHGNLGPRRVPTHGRPDVGMPTFCGREATTVPVVVLGTKGIACKQCLRKVEG